MNISDKVERLIRPEIHTSCAYAVPEATGMVKLDAMENPYPWPSDVKQAWLEMLREVDVNRYPDPDPRRLKRLLREAMGAPVGTALLLGNGSDELIQIVLLALARPDACVLAPVPTFAMYGVIANAVGMRFVGVPLDRDFGLDVSAMREALRHHRVAVTFIAYPNNPSGNLFAADAIESLIVESAGLVVIDEAYFAFTDTSFIDRLNRFDNLLVLRTLSKIGLAGLRLGILLGAEDWLREFNKVRLPYNINSVTQASVELVLAKRDFIAEQVKRICAERQRLVAALGNLPGVKPWPSETNFVLFRVPEAKQVYEALLTAGVLVKNLDTGDKALKGCLRVTVGTPQENDAFLHTLEHVLSG
jgi:histidinol-phosphate aminotransferase